VNYAKAPAPWFGGKADAAPTVWEAMGDVDHYVEPFCGSLAVLLRRPHPCNRAYYSETVNDADGLLVNAWRSIQRFPDAVAEAASWPVAEADLHARHIALLRWKELDHLMGDDEFCDPRMAGYWLWGQSSWIGGGWCSGEGSWTADDSGRLVKMGKPGVSRRLPHIGDNGQGVNHAGLREPGVHRKLPQLTNNGRGVNGQTLREPGVGESPYHPMTMPKLRDWMAFLSARLRHVRILNGDWKRACTNGAMKTLPVRQGGGHCGVFLDPPYSTSAGRAECYAVDDFDVADEVRQWCIENGTDESLRIVLAGFDVEHTELEKRGWKCVEWFKKGFLKGGMGNVGGTGNHQQKRERLWLSPHCLGEAAQGRLF